jgi:nucleoside-diphosphate-sugar epimerase
MILVTGASGFLGRHLVQYLSATNQRVRAIYHNNAPDDALRSLPGTEWLQCDLLDVFAIEQAFEDIEEVYHCAAIVSFNPSDSAVMLHFNVESTAAIVNECLDRGIKKLVYVSSVAALGRNSAVTEINEEVEWEESNLNSAYGISKYMAEMEVWRGIGEGLNAVIVNPGIILGEDNWEKGSARLMKIVYKEFPFYTKGVNGWVDVLDVVKAMYMLMDSDIHSERFILTSGNFSYKEVFTIMAHALNKKPPHIYAAPWLTNLIWRLNSIKYSVTGKGRTITKETARNAQSVSKYNNDKLLKALPSFSYTPISNTVGRMAPVFLNEVKSAK